MIFRVLGFVLALWFSGPAVAQTDQMDAPVGMVQQPREGTIFIPPWPKDLDQVDFYLATVGRGPQIHAIFGHVFLRVVDRTTGLDMNFNWGIFDFISPTFIWDFYRGVDLIYFLGVSDLGSLLDLYHSVEHRSVVMDKINLTSRQKETLMKRLIWNSQKENLPYEYSQFYDNCATKPRDHLNEALGGHIREQLTRTKSRITFRDLIRYGADAIWWVRFGLDFISNGLLDREITPWEEMFLPERMRANLRELPALDDDGHPIPGKNLLDGTFYAVRNPEPEPGPDPYMVSGIVLALLVVPACLLLVFRRRPGFQPPRWVARTFGTASVVFGTWSAGWGSVMTLNWIFSSYPELQGNWYLLVFLPLDWVFVVYGLCLWRCGKLPSPRGPLAHAVSAVAALHLALTPLLAVLAAVGAFQQTVLDALATTGVVGLVYFGTVFRSARS